MGDRTRRSLALATAQGRALVRCNIKDLVPIAQAWQVAGRPHAGIVCLAASAFPQHRGFVSSVVKAVDELLCSDHPPAGNQICFPKGT